MGNKTPVVRVGYMRSSEFPYAIPGCTYNSNVFSCPKPSLNGEILKAMARQFKYRYEFIEADCYFCNSSRSIVNLFRNGDIDLNLDLWASPGTLAAEKFALRSAALLRTHYTMVSARFPVLFHPLRPRSAIFSLPVVLTIVLTVFVLMLLSRLIKTVNGKTYNWHDYEQSNYLIVFGLVFLMLIFSANYKSQAINTNQIILSRSRPPDNLFQGLRAKELRLIVPYIVRSSVETLLGPYDSLEEDMKPIVEPNMTKLVKRLCNETERLVFNGELLPLIHAKPPCSIEILVKGRHVDGRPNPIAFAFTTVWFSYGFPKPQRRKIELLLQILFSSEKIETFWLRRIGIVDWQLLKREFGNDDKSNRKAKAPKTLFKWPPAYELADLGHSFLALLAGQTLGYLAFLWEILYFRGRNSDM